MTRHRRTLRTRLVVAMMAIALGVLVLTAVVTAGLAHRSEVTNAQHDGAGPRRGRRSRVRLAHRAAPQRARGAEHPSGSPAAEAPAHTGQHDVAGVERCHRRHRRRRRRPGGPGPTARRRGQLAHPARRDLGRRPRPRDAPRRRHRNKVATATRCSWRARSPPVNGTTPVVVLTEQVNNRPFGGNGIAVLGAAAISLGIAALVATYLARRMTRPLAAMETTARSIAGGDLTARVDTNDVRDDELAIARARHQRDGQRPRRRARPRARVPPQRVARPPHAAHVDPRVRGGDRRRHRRGHGQRASVPPT